jgi:DNA-binding response OmpR family regulator
MNSSFIDFSPSIVLADDNDMVREMAARALTSRGCQVRCAADCHQAWGLLCEAPFALLITDNEMPGLIGLDLLRRMRAASFDQPAILMSGNIPGDVPDLRELLSPGAAIAKPFGVDQLVTALCALAVFQPKSGRGMPHFSPARDRVNV